MNKVRIIGLGIVFFFLLLLSSSNSQLMNQNEPQKSDSLPPPVIEIVPSKIDVKRPEGKFITQIVKVLNRGGKPLYINNIEPSCKCASGRPLSNPVYPLEIGRIYLTINLDGLDKEHTSVEYKVESNAKNSPIIIIINVVDLLKEKSMLKDTLK